MDYGYGGMYQPYRLNTIPQQQVVRVSGENGAKAYQMGINSSALLLDESSPIVWLKTTDGAGYPSLIAYDIVPHQPEPQLDVRSFENRLSRLEGIINESYFRSHEQPKDPNKSRNKYKSNEHGDANGAERSSD